MQAEQARDIVLDVVNPYFKICQTISKAPQRSLRVSYLQRRLGPKLGLQLKRNPVLDRV